MQICDVLIAVAVAVLIAHAFTYEWKADDDSTSLFANLKFRCEWHIIKRLFRELELIQLVLYIVEFEAL